MNSTAQYMAQYGMERLTTFAEFSGLFVDPQYYLDRDMGLVLPAPFGEVAANFGEGEVIDAAPPPPTLKRKRLDPQEVGCSLANTVRAPLFQATAEFAIRRDFPKQHGTRGVGSSSAHLDDSVQVLGKGKANLHEDFPVSEGNALSKMAFDFLETVVILPYSDFFGQDEVKLATFGGDGLFAKDAFQQVEEGIVQVPNPFLNGTQDIGILLTSQVSGA